ncbi:MAG TPA: ROK family transcriptional regulator [Natronosporangium sp.]
MRAAPSQEEVRRQNLGALLRYVHRHGATTRAELTARLGLNRSTIGALTADLVAASLVIEEPPAGKAGRAGRPSLVVTPRSGTVCAYAVVIEVDRVRAARVGLGGVVLDRREAPRRLPEPPTEPARTAAALLAGLRTGGPEPIRAIGVGVAVCQRERHPDGRIGFAPRPVAGTPTEALVGPVAEVLPDTPVAVGTVADLAALAEHTRGVAQSCDNLIYLSGDVGITAGIIAGGRRIAGHLGAAGEVGHMVVNPGGLACWCGSRGCWETEVGEPALLRAGREADGRPAVRALVEAATRGDTVARDAVRLAGDWLGVGVANLVNIFNPALVVFGGTLRELFLAGAASVRSRLNTIGVADSLVHLRLRTPALGDDAPLVGAAELAFEALLADPLS